VPSGDDVVEFLAPANKARALSLRAANAAPLMVAALDIRTSFP